jgi:hypothetical protein
MSIDTDGLADADMNGIDAMMAIRDEFNEARFNS